MALALEVDQVAPSLAIWQCYDPAVKADLFSTALETGSGVYLIDPIPLRAEALRNFESAWKVVGIIVTNENHERATAQFAEKFSVPIYLHAALRESIAHPRVTGLRDGEAFSPGLNAIAIEGAVLGEIALHYDAHGGTMIVGDALINFEPFGFSLLPAKYCSDPKLMRRSLSKLLGYRFERMLFAHGTPILSGADRRLEQMLAAIR